MKLRSSDADHFSRLPTFVTWEVREALAAFPIEEIRKKRFEMMNELKVDIEVLLGLEVVWQAERTRADQ
jgi:hypothetical protein